MIARPAVIVAAGASTRLGEPKQLARLGGETLLERAVWTAQEADCSPIVVVLGASAELIAASVNLPSCSIVMNSQWSEGMATSITAGLRALADVSGVLMLTCDMPAVSAAHLRSLMATGDLTASRYGGRNGVPAFFPKSTFPQLLELRGDLGARYLLESAQAIDLPDGDLDIDTPQDLKQARARFG